MNITIFYYEDHLQKAIAINNTHNPHLEEPLSLQKAEEELLAIMSENIDELSITSLYGIFFIPQIISDPEEFEDVGIMIHIMIPPSFEFNADDLKHYVINESFNKH